MPPLRPCDEAGKKNVLLLLKSQADEALSNKAFKFIFKISLKLIKALIGVQLIICPCALELKKKLHKFCICSFPNEIR